MAWGHYWSQTPPALRIRSGDAVDVETLLTNGPDRLERAGVAPGDIEPSLRDVYREVTDKGPGGHILTGPIFVEGAEPGDTLASRTASQYQGAVSNIQVASLIYLALILLVITFVTNFAAQRIVKRFDLSRQA